MSFPFRNFSAKALLNLPSSRGVSSAGLKKKREKEESIGVSVPGSDLRLAAATA
jgi:hypothetical protein